MNNNNNNNITSPSTEVNKLVYPIKSYENAELSKKIILEENRNQSGIYRWVNNLSQKSYVGSGVDLAKRLKSYFNASELNRNPRPIKHALLKYEHKNFTLDILEYCSKTELIEREQYYIDLLEPEYNILKTAGSLLGFRHSPENIEKFKSKIFTPEYKEKLSLARKDRIVSQETRNKLALATTNYKKNNPLTPEALANIRAKTLEREGVPVTVVNTQTNEVREFTNQTEAGEFLGVSRQAIYNAIKRGRPIKEIYLISK
jgi:group I intron endonuclease